MREIIGLVFIWIGIVLGLVTLLLHKPHERINNFSDWLTVKIHKRFYWCEWAPMTSIYHRDKNGDIVSHTQYYKCRICGERNVVNVPVEHNHLWLVSFTDKDGEFRAHNMVGKTYNEILATIIMLTRDYNDDIRNYIVSNLKIEQVDVTDGYEINIGKKVC